LIPPWIACFKAIDAASAAISPMKASTPPWRFDSTRKAAIPWTRLPLSEIVEKLHGLGSSTRFEVFGRWTTVPISGLLYWYHEQIRSGRRIVVKGVIFARITLLYVTDFLFLRDMEQRKQIKRKIFAKIHRIYITTFPLIWELSKV